MPGIKIKQYIFTPSLLPSIITIALLYLMISLALWQLDRADYKANLQSIIESRQSVKPVPLEQITLQDENSWLYQPVIVNGEYDVAHQIFYDNQVNEMVVGYSIFTPLKLSATTAILVNRGWIAQGGKRTELPDINISPENINSGNIGSGNIGSGNISSGNETISMSGLLAQAPSSGLVLSSNANNYQTWPAVLQYINTEEIEKQLDYKLLPMVLILNQTEQTKLEVLPIKINMRSEKHTAYAFQWFALSFALLIIYIVVNTKKQ